MNFTPEEASHFLGLNNDFTPDDIQNAEEEMVFPLRDYFLRNPPLEALWNVRMRKLTTIAGAAEVLRGKSHEPNFDKKLGKPSSVAELLRSYDEILAALRTMISLDCKAQHVLFGAEKILELESEYNRHFLELTGELSSYPELYTPDVRIDSPLVMSLLKSGETEKAKPMIAAERQRIENSLKLKVKK